VKKEFIMLTPAGEVKTLKIEYPPLPKSGFQLTFAPLFFNP
jgi:hypothetical protein